MRAFIVNLPYIHNFRTAKPHIMQPSVTIIGAGFSGLSAASTLAGRGFRVTVLEKNTLPGGRARNFSASGFTFDMGPTWYWLPDVFEDFFKTFGKQSSDFFELKRLDPSYRMYFGKDDYVNLPAGPENVVRVFEEIEPGSGKKLEKFLAEAEYKYKVGIGKFVRKPSLSVFEYIDPQLLGALLKMDVLRSVSRVVRQSFRDIRLIRILEFPVIFLGATAAHIPALYTMMNWADIGLGTWHPMGGMYSVVDGMYRLAVSLGVEFQFNAEVNRTLINGNKITGVVANEKEYRADYLVASGDYRHMEQIVLPEKYRDYSAKYWERRKMAPSALLFYLGINKKVKGLEHHNLFFDEDFDLHAAEIYSTPRWPTNPAIYVSCSSITDPSVAPEGMENIIVLIPVAPGLDDTDEVREKYYGMVIDRLEKITGDSLKNHIVYKRIYSHRDFIADYHAFKGNAYGLANTLFQTAILKPRLRSGKISNLFYAGQLTTPGPGVPPTIISGQVVAREIEEDAGRK